MPNSRKWHSILLTGQLAQLEEATMTETTSLELRLKGKGMAPGNIRSKDIAELIEAVEEMIASQVAHENPNIKKESITIGLENISRGSLELKFKPNLTEVTTPAALNITNLVSSGQFSKLPSDTVKPLRIISSFTKRHDCTAEFYEQNGSLKLLATITPETEIPEVAPLFGETTVYGKVLRVGGANEKTPSIQFRTIAGKLVYCRTTKRLAKAIAKKLYEQIGLIGVAEWNPETLELQSFFIKAIDEYTDNSVEQGFDELANAYGKNFDSIDDVEGFCESVRYGSGMA